jgi:hypothetical protein
MLEFLQNLTGSLSFLSWLPSLPEMNVSDGAVSISAAISGAGTVVLGKFTSNIGYLTMPINYCALFIGAVMANWLLSGIHLPVDPDFQAPMIFAVAGMMITALSMMMFVKEE